MNYRKFLQSTLSSNAFWQLNKTLVKKLGFESAILLSDLISKEQYFTNKNQIDNKGGFFNTQENIEADTTLSPHKQRKALKLLIGNGLVVVYKKGIPQRLHYIINHYDIAMFLTQEIEEINNNDLKDSESVVQDIDTHKLNTLTTGSAKPLPYNKNKDNKNKDNKTISQDVEITIEEVDPVSIEPLFDKSNDIKIMSSLNMIWSNYYRKKDDKPHTIFKRLQDSFNSEYDKIYGEPMLDLFTPKNNGIIKNIEKTLLRADNPLETAYNKLELLSTIAKNKNKYQDWKFTPIELQKHLSDLVDGCVKGVAVENNKSNIPNNEEIAEMMRNMESN